MTAGKFNIGTQQILLIENNYMMRRLVRDMLVGFGVKLHHIVETDRVSDALLHVYTKKFDLIITDFFLGDLDGGDLTRHIRGDERCPNRKVPILLITGAPNHEKVLKALESGVNEVLAKPIAPSALYYRVFAILSKPRPFVISSRYIGPSRSVQRLQGLAKLRQNRPTGERQWRSVQSAAVKYPKAEKQQPATDKLLML